MESKTWLEKIEEHDPEMQAFILQEQPVTVFKGPFPPELAILEGRAVDLGFGNLGLEAEARKALHRAFLGTGVAVPGTSWRLRFVYPWATVKPIDRTEKATLPKWWKEAILVVDDQSVPTWVGNRCRPDQRAWFNLDGYQDEGEGLVPRTA